MEYGPDSGGEVRERRLRIGAVAEVVAQYRCLSVLSVKASRHAGGGLEGWGGRNS